jgi:hypothetical protein
MKRQVRNMVPFSGGGRILRFSGRSRSGHPRDAGERRPTREEDELYRALGRVAANWSLIEIASGIVLMGLVGSSEESLARAIVAGQRVENVWETIESLLVAYGENTTEELATFRSWRRSANGYRRRRNEAIHSAWSMTPGSGGPAAWDVMSQKAKRGARADLFPGGVAELEELARDIAACEERLTRFRVAVMARMEDREAGSLERPMDGGSQPA